MTWRNPQSINSVTYGCNWCESRVSAQTGLHTSDASGWSLLICPNCGKPTIKTSKYHLPSQLYGESVSGVPEEISHLYIESRKALSASAPTASIMACRKILLNLAVHHAGLDAKNEKGFSPTYTACVEHLVSSQLPPTMKTWLNTVKKTGNDANHEIKQASVDDARLLIDFVGQILKVMFEMPAKVPTEKSTEGA